MQYRSEGVADYRLKCARCLVRNHERAEEAHTCKNCKQEKAIQDFAAVSCKSWLGQTRVHKDSWRWVCEECHYPKCGQCDGQCLHPVPHNSWVAQKDYVHQANMPEQDVLDRFRAAKLLWFCNKCKYPTCDKCQTTTRYVKRENRFKRWSCAECEKGSYLHCAACGKQSKSRGVDDSWMCQDCVAWDMQYNKLKLHVAEHGSLPKRDQRGASKDRRILGA